MDLGGSPGSSAFAEDDDGGRTWQEWVARRAEKWGCGDASRQHVTFFVSVAGCRIARLVAALLVCRRGAVL